MAITHHFVDASDFSKGGRWAGDYGETLCTWTWDADARVLSVQCGSEGRKRDLRALNLDAARLTKRLPQLALQMAERITGKKFDV
jgi:hypothetical protein